MSDELKGRIKMAKTKIDTKELEKKCVCKSCPSFIECKEKILYCLLGKSECIKEIKVCICGGCPVHQELGLKKGAYCVHGKD